ncbi:hypothetical protein [Aeromonas salmonicida]|uniref:hypothetical protein n=1 Tax=Aeromonas salmonicida TaxID=645 RepID=UPI001C6349F7|nr:hypothetical protein [Aeromonas salmonicida]QYH28470.1 hypothetical protein G9H43_24000 [Aeromonas salmonicida subsp. masoucida]QYH32567.1 hypothetical protein G9457_22870 [Aeromonas salmonicida subsp. masoucida]
MAREIEQDWDVKGQDDMHQEVIRSSYLDGGDRLYLIYDEAKGVYRVGTRWVWLGKYRDIWDACDAFDVIELLGVVDSLTAAQLKREIKRQPRSRAAVRKGMARIDGLLEAVQKRLSGLIPRAGGSKASLTVWVKARGRTGQSS